MVRGDFVDAGQPVARAVEQVLDPRDAGACPVYHLCLVHRRRPSVGRLVSQYRVEEERLREEVFTGDVQPAFGVLRVVGLLV